MNPLVVLILSVRDWRRAQLIGLACVLVAFVVPRFVQLPATAGDVLDFFYLLGAGLLSPASATPPKVTAATVSAPPPDQRGNIRASLLWALAGIGLALGGAAVLASQGCATTLDLHPTAGQVVSITWDPGPPCLFETRIDGKLVAHIDWPGKCPAMPLEAP